MRIANTIVIAFSVAGCSGMNQVATLQKQHGNAVKQMRQSNPYVREFQRLFPDSEHWISSFTGASGEPRWNSQGAAHGRYLISMQMPLAIESNGNDVKVTVKGEPRFQLLEVESVSGRDVSYHMEGQRDFGPDAWRTLVESEGDLSVLGLEVVKDQPIPGIDNAWRTPQ